MTFANRAPAGSPTSPSYPPKGVHEATYGSGSRGGSRLKPAALDATAANSTGGSSTTSGLRTRTRTAVTGKLGDERVGDRGREGLEQVVGAASEIA